MEFKLRLNHISKRFPGVQALDQVDFDLYPGEVHALVGENGAGKTTLMNILSGNHQPDSGTIFFGSQEVVIINQLAAQQKGIGIVYQEKSLVTDMTVADNIYAGRQPTAPWGLIDYQKMFSATSNLLSSLGIPEISPKQKLHALSAGKQQMIEIAKALAHDPDILILDEPTAAISERDAKILFSIVRRLTAEGKSIIYISHRLQEIFEIADRVTILKDGKGQGTYDSKDLTINKVIRLMVGRDVKTFNYENHCQSNAVLQVSRMSGLGFQEISFDLHRGEILGLSGLVGAGRSEWAHALVGAAKHHGIVIKNGKEIKINHPADAVVHRIGFLPEDRKTQGLFLEMSAIKNILSVYQNKSSKLNSKKFDLQPSVQDIMKKLRIKTTSVHQKVNQLSGGNQQKIVLAKWLLTDPDILIVDEPTTGIDVGAKSEIYNILNQLTAQGKAIILISSEMPELMGLCDRILVLHEGRITGEFLRPQFSEEEIMHHASGTKNMFAQSA